MVRVPSAAPEACEERTPQPFYVPRHPMARRGPRTPWLLLMLAFAIPVTVGSVAIPWLYDLASFSVPHTTVDRPLVGAQPVRNQMGAPPTLQPAVPATTTLFTAVAQPTAPGSPRRTYTVQSGDELRHIAAKYDVSITILLELNDIPNPDSLRIGQVLRLPDSQ